MLGDKEAEYAFVVGCRRSDFADCPGFRADVDVGSDVGDGALYVVVTGAEDEIGAFEREIARDGIGGIDAQCVEGNSIIRQTAALPITATSPIPFTFHTKTNTFWQARASSSTI